MFGGTRSRTRLAASLLATAAIALTSACGGGGSAGGEQADEPPPGGDSTTATTATSTTASTPEAEVEAAFVAFYEMSMRLREHPDPNDPEIPQRTSGRVRNGVIDAATTMETLGERAEFGNQQAHHVLDVQLLDAETALVSDCRVTDLTIHTRQGSTDPSLDTYWTDWTLVRADGEWRVDHSEAVRQLEGVHPCE